MNLKDCYKEKIAEAVESCTDVELLDLVWKMLVDANVSDPTPTPSAPEVKLIENYPRTVQRVRCNANRTVKEVRSPSQNDPRLARWPKNPAGLCGQYDDGAVAA